MKTLLEFLAARNHVMSAVKIMPLVFESKSVVVCRPSTVECQISTDPLTPSACIYTINKSRNG